MIQNQREAGSNQLHVFWMHALLQILLIWYIAPVREKIRVKIKKTEIVLYVNDAEQSMKFWRDQIGMTEIEQRVGPGGSHAFAISQHGMNVSFVLLDKELVRQ